MFQTRLKELREASGYKSQQALADALGISQSTIGNWESGRRNPKHKTAIRLAQFFGVSVDYLLGIEDKKKEPLLKGDHEEIKAIRIPVLGSIPAGIPLEAIEDILDWEELPSFMSRGGKEYFGLQVKGDSMWPDYLPGDIVIVMKTPDCETGDDCVVYVNGYNATLKQVKKNEDGSLSIIPRNPNYSPRTYSVEEIENLPVSIAGVVVELRRRVGRG